MYHPLNENKLAYSAYAHVIHLCSQPRSKLVIKTISVIFLLFACSLIWSQFSFSSSQHSSQLNESGHSSYYKSDYRDDKIDHVVHLVKESCVGYEKACFETDQYAGYLLSNTDKEIFYWFVHASRDDYLERPLMVWTGAGPGSSGFLGFLLQNGPWNVKATGRIRYNKFAWNTECNILYVDHPFGVGFSVADNKDIILGDANAAADLDATIRHFLLKFPHFANNRVHLIAVSYSGHYLPTTAAVIMRNNELGVTPHINLDGFFLGSPLTDYLARVYGFVAGLYGHGLLDEKDYVNYRETCWNNPSNMKNKAECYVIYLHGDYAARNIQDSALDWKNCPGREAWGSSSSSSSSSNSSNTTTSELLGDVILDQVASDYATKLLAMSDDELEALGLELSREQLEITRDRVFSEKSADNVNYNADAEHFVQCDMHHLKKYMNLVSVQKMLHTKPCQFEVMNQWMHKRWSRADFHAKIETVYRHLVNTYPGELKIMIYNGDDDSWVGMPATTFWLDHIESWTKDEDNTWAKWQDSANQLGGYYTRYVDKLGNTAVHYSTLHSATHSAAESQPRRVYDLYKKYLYEY